MSFTLSCQSQWISTFYYATNLITIRHYVVNIYLLEKKNLLLILSFPLLLQVGVMDAKGYCVNIPWKNGGVGDNDYIFAFRHAVLPIGIFLA